MLLIMNRYISDSLSAGGTGVLVNLDRVSAQMSLLAPRVEVRGISDSGWFLDNKQYRSVECVDAHSCAPTDGVQKGILYVKTFYIHSFNLHFSYIV